MRCYALQRSNFQQSSVKAKLSYLSANREMHVFWVVVARFGPHGGVLTEIPFDFAQGRLSSRW
jgi:hypothetical protein